MRRRKYNDFLDFIICSCLKYKNRSFRRESATDYIFLSTGHSGFTQKKTGAASKLTTEDTE